MILHSSAGLVNWLSKTTATRIWVANADMKTWGNINNCRRINDLHKDCLGSRRGKSRILAVAQVDRPGLVMQSRSCFSNTCTGLTRSAGSAEIKYASALKTKLRLFVFFICFERWRSAVCVRQFIPGFDFLLLETILVLYFFCRGVGHRCHAKTRSSL